MIEQAEIISTLTPLNGTYFYIPDLKAYAQKITTLGKSIEHRQKDTKELISYVLYYDNRPEIFVTMVWTHPELQRQKIAMGLLQQLIHSSPKDIILEVHRDNTAVQLYEKLGFTQKKELGNLKLMYRKNKIAVMQPYLFPYIGYFHLIEASDLFVFYDDVNYIKGGWINRNKILLGGKAHLFTVPVSNASQFRPINETLLIDNEEWQNKFFKTLCASYRKAPHFSVVMDIIMPLFQMKHPTICDLAIQSIVNVYNFLGMSLNYSKSSECSPHTKGMDKSDRLIEISKSQGYHMYINGIGGLNLYNKEYFKNNGVELGFIQSELVEYKQGGNDFVPGLSIIDIMMYNDVETIKSLLINYKII